MKTKTVTRYYCDHCSKGSFKRTSMDHHERTCFNNPKRVCPLCGSRNQHKVREYSEIMAPVVTIEAECPHCLLSVLVQGNKGQDPSEMTYYTKEQLEEDLREFREAFLHGLWWWEDAHPAQMERLC